MSGKGKSERRIALDYWRKVKEGLQVSLSKQQRDAYYDLDHPAIEQVRKLDLPLYEAILNALGIG
jgi:hypothetical protein